MKALVTGGTGFIGSHVVGLLVENGVQVRLFSRRPELPGPWAGKNVTVFQGDLADPESIVDAMEGMDVVFHIGEIKNTTAAAAGKNIRVVRRIAEELAHAGVRRLVFVSSITVAGIPAAIPASEDTGPAVVLKDHYTEYKRKAETLIRETSGGVEYTILRPGVVYGPGSRSMKRLAGTIARSGRVGMPFPGNGKNLMPLVDVRDLARAVFQAGMKPGAANQTFNLTDGERHTWAEFFDALARARGKRMRIIPLPPSFLRLPALFGNLVAGLYGARADLSAYVDFFSRDIYFSAAKARALLGWQPAHTGVDAGVRAMLSRNS